MTAERLFVQIKLHRKIHFFLATFSSCIVLINGSLLYKHILETKRRLQYGETHEKLTSQGPVATKVILPVGGRGMVYNIMIPDGFIEY